ncbi:IS3 family transposase [Deinococcus koreensis]|uniref:IS3 family transposase n=1 Tax=Deinococcus koreensis TaxID=2054903 RepID=A0A2K3URS8_9DEIO|nr:IS3 family transposase [Deinococcus koreensis]PNY79252.1 IS3 family transposase [Deinococcus koreensis]PNY79268.1 IS3 family transposase [Deinococcus koreensis]
MGQRQRYTKEFKLEAVRLAHEPDQTFTGVSINLGISDSSLHRWAKEFEQQGQSAFPGHGKASLSAEQAEIKRLQRELDIARQERDVLKKAGGLLRQRKVRRFEFIDAHRSLFRLDVMCRMLDVTRSGYATWRGRPMSPRRAQDDVLSTEIQQIHTRTKGRYGVPRVHAELREHGMACSRRRVARLMSAAGLQGKDRRKHKRTTTRNETHPVAKDLVHRNFDVPTPNTVWAADISFLPTKEGWLYLAVILDLHSRLVVGWTMGERLTTDLPLAALNMAVARRPPPADLIHHSDRGSQYTSRLYQAALQRSGMQSSMGRKGDCFDNAVVESFFSTLKRELMMDTVFMSRQEGRSQVFEYLEIFYNRQRRHSTLGYLTPVEFEQRGNRAVA